MVEGPPSQTAVFDRRPSTTLLRSAVPLPGKSRGGFYSGRKSGTDR